MTRNIEIVVIIVFVETFKITLKQYPEVENSLETGFK